MSTFEQKHPIPIREAVGKAVADGLRPSEAQRRLAAGQLKGAPGPYEMPLETVRYYGRKEKQRRQATQLSDRVKADAGGTVDYLARSLLTAAEEGIAKVRERPVNDPEALKKWGDVLKVLGPLVRPETDNPSSRRGKRDKPSDPLTETLSAAASGPVPSPPSSNGEDGQAGAENDAEPTHTETQDAAGLLHGDGLQPVPSGPPSWSAN